MVKLNIFVIFEFENCYSIYFQAEYIKNKRFLFILFYVVGSYPVYLQGKHKLQVFQTKLLMTVLYRLTQDEVSGQLCVEYYLTTMFGHYRAVGP
jgi:hypothetical protein